MAFVLEPLAGERVADADEKQSRTGGNEDDVEHDELRGQAMLCRVGAYKFERAHCTAPI
jgi:hypothetical protein